MPTTRRDRTGRAPRCLRALAGVAVLYALVLQALLGGIAALPVEGAPGLLCLQPAGTDDASGPAPASALPHAGCCTAAGHGSSAAPPPPAAASLVRIDRIVHAAGWPGGRTEAEPAPPHTLAHARAPPVA